MIFMIPPRAAEPKRVISSSGIGVVIIIVCLRVCI